MLEKINNLFDTKVIEEDLRRNLPVYKKISFLTGFTTLMLIFLIIIGGVNMFLSNQPKEIMPFLYKQTIERKKPIEAYNNPSLSEEKIEMYVKNVMYDIFTSNFNNIEDKLPKHKKYFTANAWVDFENLMRETFIPHVVEKRLLQDIIILENPVLAQRLEDYNGKRTWVYEFKAMIRFTGSFKNENKTKSNSKVNYINVVVALKEANVKNSPLGVLIDGLNIRKYAKRD